MDWSKEEVSHIVFDYFNMLHSELRGESYNKTSHRTILKTKLETRSEASIEFKHRNISAVLVLMDLPFIKGYKPMFNYQKILENEITRYLKKNEKSLESDFEKFSNSPIENDITIGINFENLLVEDTNIESNLKDYEPKYRPIKTNYLQREQNNRNLGQAGENLILDYEKWRLKKAGKIELSKKVEWVSKEKGDGAGFDILSKNEDGSDRFIEVKTTKLSRETPIYIFRNENYFTLTRLSDFYLYRVFNFGNSPQFFIRKGKYEDFCILEPEIYKGYFK